MVRSFFEINKSSRRIYTSKMAGNNSTPAGQVDAIEEQKTTIAALCAAAANDAVRNCLRKYDPTKTSYQIERELKKDKKDVLVETLNYLGITGMGQFRADALPHELVCRVQNLLPDTCHLCKQTYCIQVGEKPIMSCAKCGQGCHNPCILQALDKTEASSFPEKRDTLYLCTTQNYICLQLTILYIK